MSILKNEEAFRIFLRDSRHLTDAVVEEYCTYVRVVSDCFRANPDDLVQDEDAVLKTVSKFPDKLRVSESSFSSYACGVRAYYEFIHEKKMSRKRESVLQKIVHSEHWYQELVVSDISDWWEFIRSLNCVAKDGVSFVEPRHWAYRGQGNSAWVLESSLGRIGRFGDQDGLELGERLRQYEKESMWTFRREAAKSYEHRGLTGVDLLSLMQHYGCKTRLLDFTMAPLVALYMAVEQHEFCCGRSWVDPTTEKVPDLVVWAVDLNILMQGNGGSTPKDMNIEQMLKKANIILLPAEDTEDEQSECGVIPVFPGMCNDRIAAQDGLFLMPKTLTHSFEENLRATIGKGKYESKKLTETIKVGDVAVYKFVFRHTLLDDVKSFLRDANVTAKMIYPGLAGLGCYISQEMMRHEDDAAQNVILRVENC